MCIPIGNTKHFTLTMNYVQGFIIEKGNFNQNAWFRSSRSCNSLRPAQNLLRKKTPRASILRTDRFPRSFLCWVDCENLCSSSSSLSPSIFSMKSVDGRCLMVMMMAMFGGQSRRGYTKKMLWIC